MPFLAPGFELLDDFPVGNAAFPTQPLLGLVDSCEQRHAFADLREGRVVR